MREISRTYCYGRLDEIPSVSSTRIVDDEQILGNISFELKRTLLLNSVLSCKERNDSWVRPLQFLFLIVTTSK